MAAQRDDIEFELRPYIRQYKDGRVHRFRNLEDIPAGLDEATGIISKDVVIDIATGVAVRLHLPASVLTNDENIDTKLPVIIYLHGGAFILCTAFDAYSHCFLNSLASQANAIAVSVNYRLAPEHPLPAAYEDSWMAIQWVFSHIHGNGTEEWLNKYGDFSRVFLSGGSAGANIAHQMALRIGNEGILSNFKIEGMVLIQPFFWGAEAIGKESTEVHRARVKLWKFVCPESEGADDYRINPLVEGAPGLEGVGCERVLVAVAEKDVLRDRGLAYYNALKECKEWKGEVVVFESEGQDHGFIVKEPESEKSLELMNIVARFIRGI